jgi:mannitol-specific phosphotransferase system IIBC component
VPTSKVKEIKCKQIKYQNKAIHIIRLNASTTITTTTTTTTNNNNNNNNTMTSLHAFIGGGSHI